MGTNSGRGKAGRVLLGALLVALGALPVIQRLGVLVADASHRAWPILMMGLSLVGLWALLAGASLLAGSVQFAHAMITSPWPLLLALLGAVMVWRTLVSGGARAGVAAGAAGAAGSAGTAGSGGAAGAAAITRATYGA